MAHHSTVFAQLLKLIPRHEFDRLAEAHHRGQRLRKASRWQQFVALAVGQLSGRQSLRDITLALSTQTRRLYHLGCRAIPRSSLARINEQQPHTLYEALFAKLYGRCQSMAPKHGFRFKNPLYSLDASIIELSLSLFPWAHYCKGKAAVKLHAGLDHRGGIPAFAAVTHGHVSDLEFARTLQLPPQSIVAFDRGYFDYAWFNRLNQQQVFLVTRPRRNALYRVIERRPVDRGQGLTSDQTIAFTGKKATAVGLAPMRRIGYRDPDTGKHYVFITNLFHLTAITIAEIYKARWQIELFFKWIKQNLKIKAFLGTSLNAIMTQLWAALCLLLLLAYLKFASRIGVSLQQILRLLSLNLFVRRELLGLFRNDPPPPIAKARQYTLAL